MIFFSMFDQQYRICFSFEGGDAHDVEVVDYH